jgi:NAD(P)-dependent dehydrogenase (short-subunit alcohol dehydrogenase family)
MMNGKVVIVTGAAKGIGRHIAATFAQAGAKVVIADIDTLHLEETRKELEMRGADVLPIRADVRNEHDVRSMMGEAALRFGRIDVLVNDAGMVTHFHWGVPRWPRVRDMDKDFWERVIQTNLGGTFLCSKHVLPYMEASRSGHIVNLHGGGSGPGAAAYVVSKEAIRVFTRFVAEEERDWNICVVAVTPGGPIATEDAPEETRRRMPGLEFVGNRFVLAAEAGMEMSGKLLTLKEGRLEALER